MAVYIIVFLGEVWKVATALSAHHVYQGHKDNSSYSANILHFVRITSTKYKTC